MPMPALQEIHNFDDLLVYLEEKLDWPLQGYSLEDAAFAYAPEELGLKEDDAARIKAIHQLRPLAHGQPWGIFFVEFEHKKLPVVVLRRILSHLVIKKRASANKAAAPAWHAEDLLFVTAFGEDVTDNREIAFAHFHQNPGDLPTLHVLGWDGGDTPLKLAQLDQTLRERLRWPEDEGDAQAWRLAWRKPFKHKIGHVIRTADLLAEELARLARGIRDKARRMLAAESEKGPLTQLFKAFQTALIHDLTPAHFADTYAQTITYGLLTAAISRTEMSEGRHGTALLADDIANIVPVTNPFLKEMLQTFLKVGGRKGGIDFDELGIQDVVELLRGDETDLPAVIADFGNKNPNEDPVIHFYEHFLAAYDKPQKKQRGVFYTPQPVVSYIVRSVHELLQTEFGLEDGLASTITWGEMAARQIPPSPPLIKGGTEANTSAPATASPSFEKGGPGGISPFVIPTGTSPDAPFVTILDPATGTATFLVEVINVIHRTLTEKWNKAGPLVMPRLSPLPQFGEGRGERPFKSFTDYWNAYVPRALLPRLYGYELMMAPYAIAHMKIGLKLFETGYRFGSEERVRVYLTNALEPAHEVQPQLEVLAPALAHEALAVANVKRDVRFTVVVGNPPYSGHSSNAGEWIVHLLHGEGGATGNYFMLDGAPLGERNPKWLNDDYVKFIRLGQWELDRTGCGTLAFITNHGYLDNPTFRGMRCSLMASFNDLYLFDLHGNSKKKETAPDGGKEENVFDIQQGVAIGIFVKRPSTVCPELVEGHSVHGSTSSPRTECPVRHAHLFGLRDDKYRKLLAQTGASTEWTALHPGTAFYLFVPQDETLRAEYEQGWKITDIFPNTLLGPNSHRDDFAIAFDEEIAQKRIADMANSFISDDVLQERYGLVDNRDWKLRDARKCNIGQEKSTKCIYRPFDFRWMLYGSYAFDYPRPEINDHLIHSNIALISTRQTKEGFAVFLTNLPAGQHKLATPYDGSYLSPLYLYPTAHKTDLYDESAGRKPNLSPAFLAALQARLGTEASSEAIFHTLYSILHSPTYRTRYADFLKIDFPRIPLPGGLPLFQALATLGSELVSLHLLESPKVNDFVTRFEGQGDNSVPKKPAYKDGAVWINASQRFEGVPEAVWNFHVGGYQVCEKWLKDRKGRTLSAEDIAHYQRVVVALHETIRLMTEIDRVIETHGGWPGAFQSGAQVSV